MRFRSILIAVVALTAFAVPAVAGAAKASPSASSTASQQTSRTYDMDFTLPTEGKSGCNVCHADPNLVRPSGEATKSLYVDQAILGQSAHADTACTGCHVDFAYKTPHANAQGSEAWRLVASTACKNCHTNEFTEMNGGAHSPAGVPGEEPSVTAAARVAKGKPARTPICGDCHGSHDIPAKNDEAGNAKFHQNGLEICGQCHTAEADQYQDYYHGAAYRAGAPDAPACWDCHGAHEMLPADNPRSPVNERQLVETCGQCHDNAGEEYVQYAELIHGRQATQDELPIYGWWEQARSAVQGAITTVAGWFTS